MSLSPLASPILLSVVTRHRLMKKGDVSHPPCRNPQRRKEAALFGCLGLFAAHRDVDPAVALGLELDRALDDREDRVVGADADARARVPLGAALAHRDVAGDDALAAVAFHAEALGMGVAAVLRGAACFLLCHGK